MCVVYQKKHLRNIHAVLLAHIGKKLYLTYSNGLTDLCYIKASENFNYSEMYDLDIDFQCYPVYEDENGLKFIVDITGQEVVLIRDTSYIILWKFIKNN
jgi:hypothetical protein